MLAGVGRCWPVLAVVGWCWPVLAMQTHVPSHGGWADVMIFFSPWAMSCLSSHRSNSHTLSVFFSIYFGCFSRDRLLQHSFLTRFINYLLFFISGVRMISLSNFVVFSFTNFYPSRSLVLRRRRKHGRSASAADQGVLVYEI